MIIKDSKACSEVLKDGLGGSERVNDGWDSPIWAKKVGLGRSGIVKEERIGL